MRRYRHTRLYLGTLLGILSHGVPKTKVANIKSFSFLSLFFLSFSFAGVIFQLIGRKKACLLAHFFTASFVRYRGLS